MRTSLDHPAAGRLHACPPAATARLVRDADDRLVGLLAPTSFEAEQYRHLCHALEAERSGAAGGPAVLAVSGPGVGDGKTTTAINLAGTLAQSPGARVLLIDTDLRRPGVARKMGIEDGAPGLADLLHDSRLSIEAARISCMPFNLSIVTAGASPHDPYRRLCAPRLGTLLAEARREFDWVVVDTPPLLAVPDCQVIARWVDGFLVVVAAHRTPRKLLEEALGSLDPEKVIGIVFNGDTRPISGYHRYYEAYGYARTRRRSGPGARRR